MCVRRLCVYVRVYNLCKTVIDNIIISTGIKLIVSNFGQTYVMHVQVTSLIAHLNIRIIGLQLQDCPGEDA